MRSHRIFALFHQITKQNHPKCNLLEVSVEYSGADESTWSGEKLLGGRAPWGRLSQSGEADGMWHEKELGEKSSAQSATTEVTLANEE